MHQQPKPFDGAGGNGGTNSAGARLESKRPLGLELPLVLGGIPGLDAQAYRDGETGGTGIRSVHDDLVAEISSKIERCQ